LLTEIFTSQLKSSFHYRNQKLGTFQFKQFSVNDDNATMKVGTDAVLLGAWCPVDDAKNILDIGTGSGIIALMLAQRSLATSIVDAIELSQEDALQALYNVRSSPWPGKVNVIHGSIQSYKPDTLYDLIVCNPPYFSNSLLPPDRRRKEARHDTNLPHPDLVQAVAHLLGEKGIFCVILPVAEADTFRQICQVKGFHLHRITQFKTRSNKPHERELMAFGREEKSTLKDELVLYEFGDTKTRDYQRLTGEFYL